VAYVGLVLMLSAWVVVCPVGSAHSAGLLSEPVQRLRTLQEAFGELAFKAQRATTGFLEQIAALQARANQQKAAIAELTSTEAAADGPRETPEQQLASITVQRDQALALVDEMQQAMAGVEDLLDTVAAERSALQRQLQATQDQLLSASGQRHARRRLEMSLYWQLGHLEDEMARLRTYRENAQLWLEDWVLDSAAALEELVVETGVDVEELIARAADDLAPGQGGPLQVAAPDEFGPGAADDPINGDIQRLELLQRIATTLPLGSPLDQFHVTGHYGKRRDPFTRTLAYHSGLDLGAPRNAEVRATAPGTVVTAGPSGPYGNLVEVDHGMGIATRYAHLKSVAAEVGEEVAFRQVVGVIGSTGRSTSRHLHYEVRIDDRTFDPAKFLDTGRLVAGIFDASAEADPE
jgi:murein DD-endopeptidase MepM/ murein hydrolase activator NlpD